VCELLANCVVSCASVLLVLQVGVRKSACRALPSDVTERVPGLVGAGATQGMSLALDVEGVDCGLCE
jgi:hypothetical protein